MSSAVSQSAYPIGRLIEDRQHALGLSRADLIRRTGQKNISKGMRRLDTLLAGDLSDAEFLLRHLPEALELPRSVFDAEVTATRLQLAQEAEAVEAERDKAWRAAFKPHAIIVPERSVPSPIFAAALIGVERLLRIDFDHTRDPETYLKQSLNRLPPSVLTFGRPIGILVNYSPDHAVRYDLIGTVMERLPNAVRPGEAKITLKG